MTYQEVTEAHLIDPRLGRVALCALSGRPNHHASQRVREFFIAKRLPPDLRFDQVQNIHLGLIGADLDSGQPVIYGQNPAHSVLDGLLASIALHPWFAPVEQEGHFIVDGGAVSNLPIEPALRLGVSEIIALDLNDHSSAGGNVYGLSQYLGKLVSAVTQRQIFLETELAETRGTPVHFIQLRSPPSVQIWDCSNCRELFQIGFEIASRKISEWNKMKWAGLTHSA